MGDYYSEMAGKRRYYCEICLSRACVTSDYVRRGIGFDGENYANEHGRLV